ncbi:MAG: putative secreted protein [Halopseudomonas sp.]|jgi:predicted secreted protein|uniref:SIMPL domain-containing protein n=1 Tax=Halopseudomonas sp. TaxID=2901191 RepID=UPI0039E53030
MRHLPFSILLLGAALGLSTTQTLASEQQYNQVSLRAEVQQAVSHDTLTVRMFAQEQSKSAGELAQRITQRLNNSLETARQVEGVNVSSGNRSSEPVYDDKRKKIIGWRERGEIVLESTDFAALSTLTGDLMDNLSLADMQFSLSPTARNATENELMREAIEAFRTRADIAAKSLGGTGYRIVNLSLDSQFMQPMAYQGAKLARMADSESAAPSVEGGQADVKLNANGTIEVTMP